MIETRKSKIANAGLGVFALKNFTKGEQICEYTGILLGGDKERNFRSDRSFDIGDGFEIYGNCIASFINDIVKYPIVYESGGGLYETHKGLCYNCEFEQVGYGKNAKIFIIAIQDISVDSELYINYGIKYWESH